MSAITNTSLFIPHVFPNFDKDYVAKAFDHCGEVERVDFVAKQDRDNLISIDHRYVQAIEEENRRLYATIAHYQQMYKNIYQQMSIYCPTV
jgi:hypothetical protein